MMAFIILCRPEDDYDFVRVEESPVPSEPEPEPVVELPADDQKSLTSDKTGPTEVFFDCRIIL